MKLSPHSVSYLQASKTMNAAIEALERLKAGIVALCQILRRFAADHLKSVTPVMVNT
jgi:hypothetical protein